MIGLDTHTLIETFYDLEKLEEVLDLDATGADLMGDVNSKRLEGVIKRVNENFKQGFILMFHLDRGLVYDGDKKVYREVLTFFRPTPKLDNLKPSIADLMKLKGLLG